MNSVQKSSGVSRNLTHLFKSYRSSSKQSSRFTRSSQDNEKQILLGDLRQVDPITRADLPPIWVDTYDQICQTLSTVQLKCIFQTVARLKSIQSERLRIAFGDTSQKDKEISLLQTEITHSIRTTQKLIMQISQGGQSEDKRVRLNVQKTLAMRLQSITRQHRMAQNAYMNYLQPFEQEQKSVNQNEQKYWQQEDLVQYEMAKDRSQGIEELVENLTELSTIFKELSALIVDQGTILDRIDYNIEIAKQNTSKGVTQLEKAEKHQKCTRASTCLILLIFLITILLLILIFKSSFLLQMSLVLPQIAYSEGVSRNLTHVFKQLRIQEKKVPRNITSQSGRAILLQGIPQSHLDLPVSKDLPPVWVDTYDKVAQDLQLVQTNRNTYSVSRLKSAQSERLRITFGETAQKDEQIKGLTQQISKWDLDRLMRQSQGFILQIVHNPNTPFDKRIRANVQHQLAFKLQSLTQQHRLTQRVYMENLKLVQGEEQPNLILEEDKLEFQFDDFEEIVCERDQGINALVNNLNELSMIFKDLSALVLHQGTVLDRIDFNIEQAKGNMGKAVVQLEIADKRQRSARASTCMMVLIVLITLLTLILIYKDK